MLDSDRPISDDSQDILGRGALADQLAAWVDAAPMGEGFVIGVTGAWGSGKTSVLNLLAARLPATTAVIRFDPWLFSGADQLVARFFEELAAQLLRTRARRTKRVARRLAEYGAAVAPAASVVIGPAGQLLGGPQQVAALRDRGVAAQREAVRDALLEESKRIVVLIDDIDRLDPAEVREVMRLVKLVADLPGVVHVLSYDRARVQAALGGDGRSYLEKIVQATMAVPPVALDRLRQHTLDWLQEAIGERQLESWDDAVWSDFVVAGIDGYLTTLRDGRRLANMIPAVLDLTGDEVAAMDVIALEAVRIFDPGVHEALASVAGDLTGERAPLDFLSRDQRKEEGRERVEALLRLSSHPAVTRDVLLKLFPAVSELLGSHASFERDSRWLAAKRVASPAVFRRYLHRALATGEAPSARVDQVVDALADAEVLASVLAAAPDAELDDLLSRARSRLAEQTAPDVVGAGLTLLRVVPRVPARRGFFDVEPARRVILFVGDLLETLPSEARPEAAKRLIDEAPTLSLRAQLLYRFRIPPEPSRTPRLDILNAEDFEGARSRLADDVRAANPEELAGEDLPLWLMVLVGEAAGKDAALELLSDQRVLRAVLESPGTSLRPLTDNGISLHLKPLVDAAGEGVLDLLTGIAESGSLSDDLTSELRDALQRPPDHP